jgi:MoxR-like ATPase
MNTDNNWPSIYEKISDKLLTFKTNRKDLLNIIEDIYSDMSLSYPLRDDGKNMSDIDPFTVLGTFNRKLTDTNRKYIIERLIEKLDIDAPIPSSFDGVPLVNNMQAWFIAGSDRREKEDIDNLWHLFENAIQLADNPNNPSIKESFINYFNKVRSQQVIKWKITFGLFWIRPEYFLNLDYRTRVYIKKFNLTNNNLSEVPSGEEYLTLCTEVKNNFHKSDIRLSNFAELAQRTYTFSEENYIEESEEFTVNEETIKSDNQYLWINFNPRHYGFKDYHDLLGQMVEYPWGENNQPTIRRVQATSKLNKGDKAILVDIEPSSGIFAKAEVVSGPRKTTNARYEDHSKNIYVFDLKVTKIFNKVPRTIISELDSFRGVSLRNLLKGVSITELSEEQYNQISHCLDESTLEIKDSLTSLNFTDPFRINGLFFENKRDIERQVHIALKQGKNIIFTGPPGTGKSKLASEIASFYKADAKLVTASSHWSTYETIGGYHPNKDNQLEFTPGLFLSCVKDSLTGDNLNQWLIIDELNRADIDKAFGSFFSVVTGDAVTLPFKNEFNQPIELVPLNDELNPTAKDNVYIFPKDWRLIATMNTADKSSLFELSYAFMRRFAFINIGVPENISVMLIDEYLKVWDIQSYIYSNELKLIWSTINLYRKLGPAIIRDLASYTAEEDNFTDAILLYVMPQLEGLLYDKINQFINSLSEQLPELIDKNILNAFADDFFGDDL